MFRLRLRWRGVRVSTIGYNIIQSCCSRLQRVGSSAAVAGKGCYTVGLAAYNADRSWRAGNIQMSALSHFHRNDILLSILLVTDRSSGRFMLFWESYKHQSTTERCTWTDDLTTSSMSDDSTSVSSGTITFRVLDFRTAGVKTTGVS